MLKGTTKNSLTHEVDKISRKSDNPSIIYIYTLKFFQIDTTNILFICGGAFAGLDKVISKEGSALGFGADVRENDERNIGDIFKVEPEDLLKFGLILSLWETPVIATLEDLDVKSLVSILTNQNALIKQYQRLFEMENIELSFTSERFQQSQKKQFKEKQEQGD